MTEQEIVEELKKRWPEPWFVRWEIVLCQTDYMARCCIAGTDGTFIDYHTMPMIGRTKEELLSVIRSLPVPSEPSGEEQADFGGWDSEEQRQRMLLAAAEDMLLVEEQRRAKLDREITTLRTALREQAEVLGRYANEDNWVALGDEHWSKDFWSDGDGFTLAQEVLSRHSGLLDGAPKKENERDAQSRS